jgi:hypothetical protein
MQSGWIDWPMAPAAPSHKAEIPSAETLKYRGLAEWVGVVQGDLTFLLAEHAGAEQAAQPKKILSDFGAAGGSVMDAIDG